MSDGEQEWSLTSNGKVWFNKIVPAQQNCTRSTNIVTSLTNIVPDSSTNIVLVQETVPVQQINTVSTSSTNVELVQQILYYFDKLYQFNNFVPFQQILYQLNKYCTSLANIAALKIINILLLYDLRAKLNQRSKLIYNIIRMYLYSIVSHCTFLQNNKLRQAPTT